MTHPLTDEKYDDIFQAASMRAAFNKGADWQLEQVIKWLNETIFEQSMWSHDIENLPEELKKAMRPQIVDLPQANSDACGEEGIERARQQTFEENDELMRLLADS